MEVEEAWVTAVQEEAGAPSSKEEHAGGNKKRLPLGYVEVGSLGTY